MYDLPVEKLSCLQVEILMTLINYCPKSKEKRSTTDYILEKTNCLIPECCYKGSNNYLLNCKGNTESFNETLDESEKRRSIEFCLEYLYRLGLLKKNSDNRYTSKLNSNEAFYLAKEKSDFCNSMKDHYKGLLDSNGIHDTAPKDKEVKEEKKEDKAEKAPAVVADELPRPRGKVVYWKSSAPIPEHEPTKSAPQIVIEDENKPDFFKEMMESLTKTPDRTPVVAMRREFRNEERFFEVVFTTKIKGELLAIMCPCFKTKGLKDNSGIVFKDQKGLFCAVSDENTVDKVFALYRRMLRGKNEGGRV